MKNNVLNDQIKFKSHTLSDLYSKNLINLSDLRSNNLTFKKEPKKVPDDDLRRVDRKVNLTRAKITTSNV